MSKLVLIIDDSELIVSMLEMICGQLGYRTTSALAFAQNEAVEGLVSSAEPVIQHRSAFCSGHHACASAATRPT